MSFINSYRYASGGDYQYIIDELSITSLDVLAFKVLTVNAGLYCIRINSGGISYDIGWDSNLELTKNSLVYDTGGLPTGNSLADLPYPVSVERWYEQMTGGVNYIPATPTYPTLVDPVNLDYTNFQDIEFHGNSTNLYTMNNASTLGALPVSFYGYNRPLGANNSNLYYFGNNGLNPNNYQRYNAGSAWMRNGGFLSHAVRDFWAHELSNFTAAGTGSEYFLDNISITSGNAGNSTNYTTLRIGAGAFFTFAISFDGIMSTSDQDDIYNYMATYYP